VINRLVIKEIVNQDREKAKKLINPIIMIVKLKKRVKINKRILDKKNIDPRVIRVPLWITTKTIIKILKKKNKRDLEVPTINNVIYPAKGTPLKTNKNKFL
jgi:hypothetical protein